MERVTSNMAQERQQFEQRKAQYYLEEIKDLTSTLKHVRAAATVPPVHPARNYGYANMASAHPPAPAGPLGYGRSEVGMPSQPPLVQHSQVRRRQALHRRSPLAHPVSCERRGQHASAARFPLNVSAGPVKKRVPETTQLFWRVVGE